MTDEKQPQTATEMVLAQAPVHTWTQEQKDLIKRTVAENATDDELALFLHAAAQAGLDPLQKQIYFVKRRQKVTKDGQERWEEKVSIQAGVDGLQARALRQPDCKGIRSAVVYAKDDFVFDNMTGHVVKHTNNPFAQGAPVGAWAIVTRAGREPFVAIVRFSEYYDDRSFLWKQKPAVMIEKVARSTALRRAYPEDFGGIYEPAEMGERAARTVEGEVLDRAPGQPGAAGECKHPSGAIDDRGFCGMCGVEVKSKEEQPVVPPAPSAAGRLAQPAGAAMAATLLLARAQACGARAKALGLDEDGFRKRIQAAGVTKAWREWALEDVLAIEASLTEYEQAEKDLEEKMKDEDGNSPNGMTEPTPAEGPTA